MIKLAKTAVPAGLALLLALAGPVLADRAPGPRYRLMLAAHGTAGYLLSGTATIERSQYRILYGAGLSVEAGLVPRWYAAFRWEILWKNHQLDDLPHIRGHCFGLGAVWLANPASRTSLFLAPEIGLITASWPEADMVARYTDGDYDLGTYTYLRLGVGHQKHSRSGVVSRFELYLKLILGSGDEIARHPLVTDESDVIWVGGTITVGVPFL